MKRDVTVDTGEGVEVAAVSVSLAPTTSASSNDRGGAHALAGVPLGAFVAAALGVVVAFVGVAVARTRSRARLYKNTSYAEFEPDASLGSPFKRGACEGGDVAQLRSGLSITIDPVVRAPPPPSSSSSSKKKRKTAEVERLVDAFLATPGGAGGGVGGDYVADDLESLCSDLDHYGASPRAVVTPPQDDKEPEPASLPFQINDVGPKAVGRGRRSPAGAARAPSPRSPRGAPAVSTDEDWVPRRSA